jgi:hypothetical protein
MKMVQDAAKRHPDPLYLKLVLDESTHWKSYDAPEVTVLEESVSDVINALFDRLESTHGELLVGHALGYITCARNGIR